MQRFQGFTNAASKARSMMALALLGVMLLLARDADAAVVSGVVRDAQGVAQMGALVQVLGVGSATVGTAFTDQRGRYVIANLLPGRYVVRASALLFVPTTKNNLQLLTGTAAVVNLTLAAMFDAASWLPAQRRRASDADDDWKWALRSSANRPILRMVEDGDSIEVSSSAVEQAGQGRTTARAAVMSGDGEFGGGGLHNVITIHRPAEDGGNLMLRADVGSAGVPLGYGPSQELDAGYERRVGVGGASRVVVSYHSHPELVSSTGTGGLENFSITTAQRMMLGEWVEVEVGGRLEAVHAGSYALASRPFVRLTGHPAEGWTLIYRMANDRELQAFDDVTSGGGEIPVALVRDGKLRIETGRHQEISVGRKAARASIEGAYYLDALRDASVSGGGAGAPLTAGRIPSPSGVLFDPATGSFRALVGGYTTSGARVTASAALTSGLWVAAEYSGGAALASTTGPEATFAEASAGLHVKSSQTATLALKGRIGGTGTRVRAAYRWQPSKVVTAVNPYSAFGDQAYLSCLLHQPLRWGTRLPQGLEATIDVTNLLAEGYRPFLSADGKTLYFAESPRTIQAGLSFSF